MDLRLDVVHMEFSHAGTTDQPPDIMVFISRPLSLAIHARGKRVGCGSEIPAPWCWSTGLLVESGVYSRGTDQDKTPTRPSSDTTQGNGTNLSRVYAFALCQTPG